MNNHNTSGELEAFIQSILNDTPVPTTAYDGERTVVVCVTAADSARLGKTLEIHYPKEEL